MLILVLKSIDIYNFNYLTISSKIYIHKLRIILMYITYICICLKYSHYTSIHREVLLHFNTCFIIHVLYFIEGQFKIYVIKMIYTYTIYYNNIHIILIV